MGFFKGEVTDEGFEPSTIHRWLAPKVSGNDVNGLGEQQVRRPKKIYHFATSTTRFPFFWLNVWFIIQAIMVSAARKPFKNALDLHRAALKRHYNPEATKVEKSPEQWSKEIKQFALDAGADVVGITKLDPNWVYQGSESQGDWLIMLGFLMDHDKLKTAPEVTSMIEVLDSYGLGGEVADKLSTWLADQGYEGSGGCLMPDYLNQIPAAIAAGLGELGKHGSLIHGEKGSALRLAHVATNLPLVQDEEYSFDLDDFCTRCQVCTKACPANAIGPDKQVVRGVERWYVDFDKCLPYFNDNDSCAICIVECPWSFPDRAPNLVKKLQRRKERKAKEAS